MRARVSFSNQKVSGQPDRIYFLVGIKPGKGSSSSTFELSILMKSWRYEAKRNNVQVRRRQAFLAAASTGGEFPGAPGEGKVTKWQSQAK